MIEVELNLKFYDDLRNFDELSYVHCDKLMGRNRKIGSGISKELWK